MNKNKIVMGYDGIDLKELVYSLTQENDIGIDIDRFSDEAIIGFKILISRLSMETGEVIKLRTTEIDSFFGSISFTKKIKKGGGSKVDIYTHSKNFHDWILDSESSESKLFRLLLHRKKKGYRYPTDYEISTYKINLPEQTKIQINNLSFREFTVKKFKTGENDKTIEKPTYSTSLSLDKNYIKNYFKEKLPFYNRTFSELKNDDYFKGRSKESIISERNDFISAHCTLYNYLNSRREYLDVTYTIASSRRHYTFLGSLNKRIRSHILHGYTEYDLDNASANYLYQVYHQIKTEEDYNELKLIKYYLDNKKEFRLKVASTISGLETPTEQDISDAKQILTSLFFGSKGAKPKDFLDVEEGDKYKGAILNILITKERQENFYSENYIKGFIGEVKVMMDVISTHIKKYYFNEKKIILKVNKRKYYFRKKRKISKKELKRINFLEKQLEGKLSMHYERIYKQELEELKYKREYSKNSAIAFLYQSWEANFMLGEVKIIKDEQKIGNKNYFLLHDAVYLKEKIDKNLLMGAEQSGEFKVTVDL